MCAWSQLLGWPLQEEEAAEAAAQEAVTAMLQQRAASKAAWQSAARRAALEWLRSPATEAAAKAVADWQDTLQVGRASRE